MLRRLSEVLLPYIFRKMTMRSIILFGPIFQQKFMSPIKFLFLFFVLPRILLLKINQLAKQRWRKPITLFWSKKKSASSRSLKKRRRNFPKYKAFRMKLEKYGLRSMQRIPIFNLYLDRYHFEYR